jgi:hypothetical protein
MTHAHRTGDGEGEGEGDGELDLAPAAAIKALELDNARLRAEIAAQYAREAVRTSAADATSQSLLSASQREPGEVRPAQQRYL